MKLHSHHGLRWLAFAPAIATTFALAAQAWPDEGAGSWLSLIPHASAAPAPEPPAPPPEAPAGQRIKVLSYNAAGAVRGKWRLGPEGRIESFLDGLDDDGFRFVDVLAERIAAERPQLVGLQEMCGSQVSHLEWALASRGYPMTAHFIGNSNPDARCPTNDGRWPAQSVGKAVLAQGAHTPERHSPLVNVCVRYEGALPIRFCTIHTKPEEDGGTLRTAASDLNGLAEQGAVIVVGDFNAEPRSPAMDRMYKRIEEPVVEDPYGHGSFYEAGTMYHHVFGTGGDARRYFRDGDPTFEDSTHGLRKIDYVFADAGHFPRERMTAWVEDTAGRCGDDVLNNNCSDHRMLWAEVSLGGGDELHCGEVRETIPIVGEPKVWFHDWEVSVVRGDTGCDEALRVIRTFVERSQDLPGPDHARWRSVVRDISGWSCVDIGGQNILGCRKGKVPATAAPPAPDQPVIAAFGCAEDAKPCSKRFVLKLPHCGGWDCMDSVPWCDGPRGSPSCRPGRAENQGPAN
jgi:endonuclease/exonuclease/phosphatase family metal-dependent hydrolase